MNMNQENKMKKLLLYLGVLISLSSYSQDYEYKLNTRTGRFDMVRSQSWVNSQLFGMPFNGNRTVTRPGLPAVNVNADSLVEWIDKYFFPSTSPIAIFNMNPSSESNEFMIAGSDLTSSLQWKVDRPIYCQNITAITVDGIAQAFGSIPEGSYWTGTATTTMVRNVDKTFTITATASDGKIGTGTYPVYWRWKRYWGSYSSAVPPTDPSFSIVDASIRSLSQELSTTRVKSYDGINGGGNYLVFAFPSSWGTPTFIVNGLINTAFTKVRDNTFINASGGTTNYQVWVSNYTQSSAIADFEIQ